MSSVDSALTLYVVNQARISNHVLIRLQATKNLKAFHMFTVIFHLSCQHCSFTVFHVG